LDTFAVGVDAGGCAVAGDKRAEEDRVAGETGGAFGPDGTRMRSGQLRHLMTLPVRVSATTKQLVLLGQ
jgi:hypothetical protein